MVTRRQPPRFHYFIKEWIEHLRLSDETVAEKVGLSSRTALWKQYSNQSRLSPEKVLKIADALEIHPNELLFPPEVPSLDAIAEGATEAQRAAMVGDIVRRMKQAGS